MIWFVPMSLIFILLFCGLGLAAEAINSFLDALPFILAALLVSAVLFAIHCMVRRFREKRKNALYSVSEAVMVLSVTLGIFAFAGPTYIDRCGRFFTWFGDGVEMQILTYIGIVLVFSAVAMILAFLIRSKAISCILLLLPIALPFAIYAYSLSVGAESYSDYVTTYFTPEDFLPEYRVTKDTPIYYPDILKGESPLPALLPVKYTTEEFQEGEIVYAVYGAAKEDSVYLTVSNGTLGGLVAVEDLEAVETPQYAYEIRTVSEECAVYKANAYTVTYNFPVEGFYTIWSRTDEVIATLGEGEVLAVTDPEDGFLRILLSDGREGYLSRDDVAVVRTPLGGEGQE